MLIELLKVEEMCSVQGGFGWLYPPQPPWIDGAVVAKTVAHSSSSRQQLSGERGARMKNGLGETRVIPITLCRPVRPQITSQGDWMLHNGGWPRKRNASGAIKHLRTVATGERDWLLPHGGERREGELRLLHLVPRYKLDVWRRDVDFYLHFLVDWIFPRIRFFFGRNCFPSQPKTSPRHPELSTLTERCARCLNNEKLKLSF